MVRNTQREAQGKVGTHIRQGIRWTRTRNCLYLRDLSCRHGTSRCSQGGLGKDAWDHCSRLKLVEAALELATQTMSPKVIDR